MQQAVATYLAVFHGNFIDPHLCSFFDSSPLKYSARMMSSSVLSWQLPGSDDPSASSFSISALGESSRYRRTNELSQP